MASINHPDKIVLDAYSDPNLRQYASNGIYNRFVNRMKTPILNATGIQLLNANFINSALQLNDASMLMFFCYVGFSTVNLISQDNLRCIRLHPSTFVPKDGYTAFVKNKYFNNCTELAGALNQAASNVGDSNTYNPIWYAGDLVFAYDIGTRKFTVSSSNGNYVALAAADDPHVISQLSNATTQIKMNGFNSDNNYATATVQPYQAGISMNARLGYAMSYNSVGLWRNPNSLQGCATSTQTAVSNGSVEADANPILLGSQNVNVYLSVALGSGLDSWSNRKNLISSIPIEVAPLSINSYTASSVEKPAVSMPQEVYEIAVELFDDNGTPFYQPPNFNSEFVFSIYY